MWKYYPIMIFLEPYVQERPTSENVPKMDEDEDEDGHPATSKIPSLLPANKEEKEKVK